MVSFSNNFKLKKKITIGFVGFWKGFTLEQFSNRHPYLLKKYDFQESSTPDHLFVSVFKNKQDPSSFKDSVKIFYSGENVEPDMEYYDYGIIFSMIPDENHFRLPC